MVTLCLLEYGRGSWGNRLLRNRLIFVGQEFGNCVEWCLCTCYHCVALGESFKEANKTWKRGLRFLIYRNKIKSTYLTGRVLRVIGTCYFFLSLFKIFFVLFFCSFLFKCYISSMSYMSCMLCHRMSHVNVSCFFFN